jgi:hypothetical protein
MQFFDGAMMRDGIVALAWAATTAWLKLCAAAAWIACHPSARLHARLHARARALTRRAADPAADPAAQVGKLAHMAERSVWRCETLAALHADARGAIAQAQDDYSRALAQISSATAAAQHPAQGSRQCAGEAAPLAA